MKVLLVSQEYPPETGWGGIGTYVGIIAPALAEAGAEVHVLSVVPGQAASTAVRDGVVVHRVPLRRPPGVSRITRMPETWNRLSLATGVAWHTRRLHLAPDVIECPEWQAEGWLLVRQRVPVVVRLHSSAAQVFPHLGPVSRDQRIAIEMEHATVRRADAVTGTASQRGTAGPEAGIEGDVFHEITYPVRPVPVLPSPTEPVICFAGRFERRKGAEVVVQAMPAVVAAVPGARLRLVGRDSSDRTIPSFAGHLNKMAAELGVAHAVEIVDRWGTDAVAEELAHAAVCVVPSKWESFGYVAAEAAAMGRAVVASRIPALTEVVEDGVTGRLCDPESQDEWAAALIELLSDPGRAAAAGQAGAARMAERCSPARVARLTLAAYEAAIAHAGSSRPRSRR